MYLYNTYFNVFFYLLFVSVKHTCLCHSTVAQWEWGGSMWQAISIGVTWIQFLFCSLRLLLTRDGGVGWRLLQSSSRMNHLPEHMENTLTGSQSSHASLRDIHSINPAQLMARIESYEGREKKGISDVRRTFCLFVTFDLLFVTLLWIIELNVSWFCSWLAKTVEIFSHYFWLI